MTWHSTMQLNKEIKNDIKAAKKLRLPWWGIVSGIIGSALCAWLFDQFGKLDLVLPTLNGFAVLGFTIALKWKLRQRVWFWTTLTVIAAVHVVLVVSIPWSSKWIPAMAIAAIDTADLVVILGIISVVGKFMEGPKTSR